MTVSFDPLRNVAQPRFLIIGLGGHSHGVILPVLSARYPKQITVISRNPADSLNVSRAYRCDAATSLQQAIVEATHIFLLVPPAEYLGLLEQIPLDKAIWIEKPLTGADDRELDLLSKMLRQFTNRVWVGFLKRKIINDSLTSSKINAKIRLPVAHSKGWRAHMRGGDFYADGIHAVDLAVLLLGQETSVTHSEMSEQRWRYTLTSARGECLVEIGETEALIEINGENITEQLGYNYSQQFFSEMLQEWTNGASNLESAVTTHRFFNSILLKSRSSL